MYPQPPPLSELLAPPAPAPQTTDELLWDEGWQTSSTRPSGQWSGQAVESVRLGSQHDPEETWEVDGEDDDATLPSLAPRELRARHGTLSPRPTVPESLGSLRRAARVTVAAKLAREQVATTWMQKLSHGLRAAWATLFHR